MKLSDAERREREQLHREMFQRFENIEQVRAVHRRVREWLQKHPDDTEILIECESLYMLEGAFLKR